LLIYSVGTGQLWGARNLAWNHYAHLLEYHMLLPYAGISLAVGCSIAYWNVKQKLLGYIFIGAFAIFCLQRTYMLGQAVIPSTQAVLQARSEFLYDYHQVLKSGLPIPNKSLAEMFNVAVYDWTDLRLFVDPQQVQLYKWP